MSFVDLITRVVESNSGIDIFLAALVIMPGALECYSGYKAIKVLRSLYGFIFGVVIGMLVGILVGKITGSVGMAAGVGVGAGMMFGVAVAILAYMLYAFGTILFTYLENTILLNEIEGAPVSQVGGTVTDAVTGEPIEGVQLKFRNNWGQKN